MLISLRKFIDKRNRNENGDVVETLFMIPFAVFIIFALINMSMYWQARSVVQNIARDGARQVALYGGSNADAVENRAGQPVSTLVYNKLYAGGNCTQSNCTKPPVVTCTPGYSNDIGVPVSCSVTYYYSPVALDWFGFDKITAQPFTVKAQTISETGRR